MNDLERQLESEIEKSWKDLEPEIPSFITKAIAHSIFAYGFRAGVAISTYILEGILRGEENNIVTDNED